MQRNELRTSRFTAAVVVTVLVFGGPASLSTSVSQASTVTVPGTANPWLAGMPDGTLASGGTDVAPDQSPVLVTGIAIVPGLPLEFTNVAGAVNNDPASPTFPPDGWPSQTPLHGVEHGKSGIVAPTNSLLGVFLDGSIPSNPVPLTLDFGTTAARDYLALTPLLKQVFFIGDGLTSLSEQQSVVVPDGATRLILGTMDGTGWFNNGGSFTLDVTPEPATLSLLVLGGLMVSHRRRRQ